MSTSATIYMTANHIEASKPGDIWAVKAAVYKLISETYPWVDSVSFVDKEHPKVEMGLQKGLIRSDIEPWLRVVAEVDYDGEVTSGDESQISCDIRDCIIAAADEHIG